MQDIELLKLKEAAEYLNVPEATVRYWHSKSKGPAIFKVGRSLMTTKADLDAYVTELRDATLAER